ncbi:MAG: hypothetical protein Q7R60_04360 [bacterium]|nr:hypothetical protein [bacterium]
MGKPKYELVEALTTAAADAHEILGGQYNPDVAFWEAMLVSRIKDPGAFLVAIINELGYDRYLEIRNQIAKEEKDFIEAA